MVFSRNSKEASVAGMEWREVKGEIDEINRGQYVKGTEARINKDYEFYPKAFKEQLESFEWPSDLIDT